MKNLFIPYELAVIAKEKGFDEPCFGYFDIGCQLNIEKSKSHDQYYQQACLAPTHQQIVDWFREKHGIHIQVDPFNAQKHKRDLNLTVYDFTLFLPKHIKLEERAENNYETYYSALNKAIEESFKLIDSIPTLIDNEKYPEYRIELEE